MHLSSELGLIWGTCVGDARGATTGHDRSLYDDSQVSFYVLAYCPTGRA